MGQQAIVKFIAVLVGVLTMPGLIYAQAKESRRAGDSAPQASISAEPISLDTPTGKLYGTLELPKTKPRFPVALILAGSGPTDRDGNSAMIPGSNNSLKMLAEGLAMQGIASVRFDKRGVAESGKATAKEDDLRFDTYIDDAVTWGKLLRGDKRFSQLIVIGHSEGSLIGMIAAQRMGADGFVSVAGPGRPAQEAIMVQARAGNTPPDILNQIETILKSLAEGKTVDNVPPALATLFRPSVQPYMISWFKYDPSKEIVKLSVPVLITQGTTDIQVGVDDAKLLSKARPTAKLLIIEGMNHVLKDVPAEREKQLKSYSDPTLPVSPRLISEMSSFIKSVRKR